MELEETRQNAYFLEENFEYIENYISRHRGQNYMSVKIIINGRGHCNEEVTLNQLKELLKDLKPQVDNPDADIWIDIEGNNEYELKEIGFLKFLIVLQSRSSTFDKRITFEQFFAQIS